MKILVIGSGGREHALVWKLAQSHRVGQVICAPGNPGIAKIGVCRSVAIDDLAGLLRLALEEKVDLTVVGPELPLCLGIADLFREHGLLLAGPGAYAAQMEGSKAFSKKAMTRFGIPTAAYQIFDRYERAESYVKTNSRPLVVKADGLAGGKGVYLCRGQEEALLALNELMCRKVFGAAGETVIIEEWLQGEEASFLVFCDGQTVIPMPPTQDHKAVGEGDTGPNTGGMGAYSPAPVLSSELQKQALDQTVYPLIRGLAQEGHPFQGILYAGLMITPDGRINVLEYNVRFGDPECQPLLLRLESDLAEILLAVAEGGLDKHSARWSSQASACVVLCAQGYPGAYAAGQIISGLDSSFDEDVELFYAGIAMRDGMPVSQGGRVLGVCARAEDLSLALSKVYTAINSINFEGMHYRRDIGRRAFGRILVGIIMGSASDWEVMKGARDVLEQLQIASETKILSAHRTPEETLRYVRGAAARGLKVIIAGAGWAAHLAGVAAANTLLPVIGVPIDSSPLSGLDALLATVQMPPGIPVATVAIGAGGARNAGFLAAHILALQDSGLTQRLLEARREAARNILAAPALA
jgi:phosphoribosylamine--glycine ligase